LLIGKDTQPHTEAQAEMMCHPGRILVIAAQV
jgi:hypothetical protein